MMKQSNNQCVQILSKNATLCKLMAELRTTCEHQAIDTSPVFMNETLCYQASVLMCCHDSRTV
jgi:hypothetical protein